MGKFISRTITIGVVLCGICFVTCNFHAATNIEDTPANKINQNNNMLSMMLETDSGSGQYEKTSLSSWPTDGYVFNEQMSKCEQGSILRWDDANKKVIMEGNVSDKCYVYFDVYSPPSVADYCTNGQTLSSCITTFGNQGYNISNMYIHNSSLTNGAGDNSYRFAGADPNNYVCFGSDETTCPNENLYRIIGLIDGKVKLISADGATTDMLGTNEGYVNTYQAEKGSNSSYYKGNGDLTKIGIYKWTSTGTNTWSSSTTNTINLNTNYLTYLDGKNTKWKNMITDTNWYVGGMTRANGNLSNAKTAYDYEVGANKDTNTTVTSKIGLMYVSDYYYAASKDYWTLPGMIASGNDYRKSTNDNWMSIGLYEWTISRNTDYSDFAFIVRDDGGVRTGSVDNYIVLRPSFSLSSSIKFTSGEGTAVNPIRINL